MTRTLGAPRQPPGPGVPTPPDGHARVESASLSGTAGELLAGARRSFAAGDLDEAVRCGEELLDLAVQEHDPEALRALGLGTALLDRIFAARLEPRSGLVVVGACTAEMHGRLSPSALALIASISRPTSIDDVIAKAPIPNRDCVRLLAGLMRRAVLVRPHA